MKVFYSNISVLFLSIAVYTTSLISETDAANGLSLTQNRLATATNDFAFDLYRKVCESEAGKNVLLSPASISIGLAMLHEGAEGQTKSQISTAMRLTNYSSNSAAVKADFKNLIRGLNSPTNDYTLQVANRLFGKTGYDFRDDFLQVTDQYFNARLEDLNFGEDPSGSRSTINNWVAEKTSNKIKDLLPDGIIDDLTVLVLVNAIYFKGLWLHQFNKSNTKNGVFHLTRDEQTTVNMMALDEQYFNYYDSRELGCRILELPYAGDQVSMFLFLPHDIEGLPSVESRLGSANLDQVFRSLSVKKVSVSLPRFVLNQQVSLKEFLKKVGIEDVFIDAKADLSGIDGTKNLVLSEAVHQAYVAVNEEGTEAAGSTAYVIRLKSAPITIQFDVDRPFLFSIVEKSSGTVLFLGRVTVPQEEEEAVAAGVHSEAVVPVPSKFIIFELMLCLLFTAVLFIGRGL